MNKAAFPRPGPVSRALKAMIKIKEGKPLTVEDMEQVPTYLKPKVIDLIIRKRINDITK